MPAVRNEFKSITGIFLWVTLLFGITTFPAAYANPDATLTIKNHKISVEIADTEATRSKGLMFRKHLETNHGMLFVFDKPELEAMWMQNTYIPLSVAFIDDKGVIVNIENMAPLTRELHESNSRVLYALEMNVDWFKKNGIKASEKVIGLDQFTTKHTTR